MDYDCRRLPGGAAGRSATTTTINVATRQAGPAVEQAVQEVSTHAPRQRRSWR